MQPILRPWFPMIAMLGLLVFTKAGHAQPDEEITNSIGMKLVLIPDGTLILGLTNQNEPYEVTISKDYYIGVTEVTQAQYEKVIGSNPSYFQANVLNASTENHPVEQVSWQDAVDFCNRLSGLPEERDAGRVYRLPTEAEWEYARRAGCSEVDWWERYVPVHDPTTKQYPRERLALTYGWLKENSEGQTHAVAQKEPNAWGLYDMNGNVWEWCSDWYSVYTSGKVIDPVGPREGWFRVVRGGSWYYDALSTMIEDRIRGTPEYRTSAKGFRVVMICPEIITDSYGPNQH